MSIELNTKLLRPALPAALSSRSRLHARLDAALQRPLVLVSAPSGFGKTTLLADWLQQAGQPAPAWLSLDTGDNDPARFMRFLAGAVDQLHAGLGDSLLALLTLRPLPPVQTFASTTVEALSAAGIEGALVLDDYHLITASAIHQAVAHLVEHAPAQFHLIVAARSDPALPLARWRTQGLIAELGAEDLRFTTAETAGYLQQTLPSDLPQGLAAKIAQCAAGRAANLQMAALAVQLGAGESSSPSNAAESAAADAPAESIHTFIENYAGDEDSLFADFATEMLRRLPQEVRRFLIRTSVLSRLSGPLCDSLLDEGHPADAGENSPARSQAVLQQLERKHLFVTPLDGDHHWFRYHPLFADLLRRFIDPANRSALHRRAAAWYTANGLAIEAIEHALASNDSGAAAEVIEQSVPGLVERAEFASLRRFVRVVPESLVKASPALCLAHAYVALNAAEFKSAKQWALRAVATLGTRGSKESRHPRDPDTQTSLRARVDAVLGALSVRDHDYSQAIQLTQRSFSQLPESEPVARAEVALDLGEAKANQADYTGAMSAFDQSIQLSRQSASPAMTVIALAGLARVSIRQGLFRQASTVLRETAHEDQMSTGGRRPLPSAGLALTLQAGVLREWNQLDEALRCAEEGLRRCQAWGRRDTILDAQIEVALVLGARGDHAPALAMLGDTELALSRHTRIASNTPRVPDASLLRQLAQIGTARAYVWLMGNDHESLARWVTERGLRVDGPAPDPAAAYLHAWLLITQHRPDEALAVLKRLRTTCESQSWRRELSAAQALEACAHRLKGSEEDARLSLRRALDLAEPEGYTRIFLDPGAAMAAMLVATDLAESRLDSYRLRLVDTYRASVPVVQPGSTDQPAQIATPDPLDTLSPREMAVLQLIAEGLSDEAIARRLAISASTVKAHARSVYGKLGVSGRAVAVTRARELGMLPGRQLGKLPKF